MSQAKLKDTANEQAQANKQALKLAEALKTPLGAQNLGDAAYQTAVSDLKYKQNHA